MNHLTENRDAAAVTIGIGFAMLAAMSFASAGFLANLLVDRGIPGVIVAFYEALFGLVFVSVVNLRARRMAVRISFVAIRWVALTGVLFSLATASFYTALSRLDFSVAAPIVGAVPLASYVFVLIALRGHERLTKRAIVGAVLVVAGVGVIGVTNG